MSSENKGVPEEVAAMMAEAEAQARAPKANAARGAIEVAAAVLERFDGRPGDDRPDEQREYDALLKMATNIDVVLARYPLTDLGNAERFAARHRGKFLHAPELGWLAFDGRRWSLKGAEAKVMLAAHATARAIQTEADAIRRTDDDIIVAEPKGKDPIMLSDRIAAHGRSTEGGQRLTAMVKHAAPYLIVSVDDLDANPWAINVENGTLVVDPHEREGDPIRFRPHDPADLITKLAPVKFDPDARCPRYDRFMDEVQPLENMQRHLHQWGGYGLTGDVQEQKLCFWYGKGRNGKSTLVDAWGFVAGDYGETVPIETFLDQGRGRNAGAATPDLALLPGVRFLRTSEPEKGSKLAEALIKLVTGGEPIQARHLNRDYFKFRPVFKLTMSGNYRPQIAGTDEGIWRRVVLVPWSVTVEKPESHLHETLRGESSGILNRLLDGLRDYLDNGLVLPREVSDATQAYREDSDPLGRFLSVAVERVQGERVASSRMHAVFVAWAKAMGEREWSPKGLTGAMKERGYSLLRSDGSHWLDVRLIKSEVDFMSPAPPDQRAADR